MSIEENQFLGKVLRIGLIDGRFIVGVLEAVDHEGNLCLRNPIECRILKPINENEKNIIETVNMRNCVIPKGHWTSVSIQKNN